MCTSYTFFDAFSHEQLINLSTFFHSRRHSVVRCSFPLFLCGGGGGVSYVYTVAAAFAGTLKREVPCTYAYTRAARVNGDNLLLIDFPHATCSREKGHIQRRPVYKTGFNFQTSASFSHESNWIDSVERRVDGI